MASGTFHLSVSGIVDAITGNYRFEGGPISTIISLSNIGTL